MMFTQLPDDVLFHILSHLDHRSLSRLSQVCKSLNVFVNRDAVWRKAAKGCLNSGITWNGTDILPVSSLHQHHFHIPASHYQSRCIFINWRYRLLFPQLSAGAHLENLGGLNRGLSGFFSDGTIVVHNRRNRMSLRLMGHSQEVNCLDTKNGLIVSGSRDRTARMWTLTSSSPLATISMIDRVWSVAISPTQSSFVTGTACCEDASPLRIWDVELACVCSLGSDFRRGAGVLDIAFESPFQLFTCGYDTFIRQWDLRLSPQKCVMEWEEPHDSALYCIQTDGNNMIASGSSYYGVVRIWDKRQARCLQFFQLSSDSVSSPVYCLRFSSSHLYAALATALHCLDFRQNPSSPRRKHC
uniref:F-box and WD repeat domain containing 4 n=1 Tax=Cyprinodon variegatus TaxID=28743 RepID=A0A3Q2DIT1_CYPVA